VQAKGLKGSQKERRAYLHRQERAGSPGKCRFCCGKCRMCLAASATIGVGAPATNGLGLAMAGPCGPKTDTGSGNLEECNPPGQEMAAVGVLETAGRLRNFGLYQPRLESLHRVRAKPDVWPVNCPSRTVELSRTTTPAPSRPIAWKRDPATDRAGSRLGVFTFVQPAVKFCDRFGTGDGCGYR
jgi:hypothetical protein